MRVVHITTIDEGGAYKAVIRTHQALKMSGVDSHILLRNKLRKDHEGQVFLGNIVKTLCSKGKNLFNMLLSRGDIACEQFGSNVLNHPLVREADIIAIHWCNSFLSYNSLDKLLKSEKKIIFFLHDTWLFTGGCHVNLECNKYESGCGNCPYIKGDNEKDLSYRNFERKRKLLESYSVQIVGPSRWIVDCAAHSAITKAKNISYIPNCIDTGIFQPLNNRDELKKKYGIPENKKVVLFGAAFNGTQNKNKGFGYLLDALKLLPKEQYFLLVFGNCEEKDVVWKQDYKLLGYVHSEQEMAEVYNLADVYATPSLQESFGFTVCESMACGTPTVAFTVGGILDQIVHLENGYLAQYRNVEDLAKGIEYCARNSSDLGEAAHKSALRFSLENVGKEYCDLLNKM